MKISTINYPEIVALPSWLSDASPLDGPPGFSLTITGAQGRRIRAADATINTDAWYDNLYIRDTVTQATIYMQNGAGQTSNPVVVLSASSTYKFGAENAYTSGAIELTLEIETGIETGAYVPLAESDVSYTTSDWDGATLGAAVAPPPPAPCFWTDLVRVTQDCDEGGS